MVLPFGEPLSVIVLVLCTTEHVGTSWELVNTPPNAAVRGDMGWKTPLHQQWICVTRMWCRLSVMPNERLTRTMFRWANSQARGKKKDWAFKVRIFLNFKSIASFGQCWATPPGRNGYS